MATTIKLRRDLAATWASKNPIPAAGEPCFETDTGKLKIGDGSTAYNSLHYVCELELAGKVDKVTGKGLSTNDFTNEFKTKLEGIAEGAEVNKIVTVKVNGAALTPDGDRAVNVEIPAADEYTIGETTTTSGMLKTYGLYKNGTLVAGSIVDIPKDFLVKSASMGVCETKDQPIAGLEVGDPYLDFVINVKSGTATDEHIYINVKGLVDVYTAGKGINIENNEISVDTTDAAIADTAPVQNSTKFIQSGAVFTINAALTSHTGNADIHVTAEQKAAWTAKQNAITADNKLNADLVDDSAATNKFVTAAEKATWNGKQDAITASNKLSADLVQAGTTNAVVTNAEKAAYDALLVEIDGGAA